MPPTASGMGNDMDEYLSGLKTSRVRSLQELVDWNVEHAEVALTAGLSPFPDRESALAEQ